LALCTTRSMLTYTRQLHVIREWKLCFVVGAREKEGGAAHAHASP
jgi:hypothetical protein